jgi:signal transduction histidine kinase
MTKEPQVAGGSPTDLAERVIMAREAERARIARELHDETGQWLASLLLQITMLLETSEDASLREKLGQMLCSVTASIEGVRRITRGLRPRALDETDLATALGACANDFQRSCGISVEIEAIGLAGSRLPQAVEVTVFRVVQEALTNVARHSGAAAVSVVVDRNPKAVRILVEDDGNGFDPTSAGASSDDSPTGLGLRGLRERIDLLQGALEIESGSRGTTLYVTIPLRAAAAGPRCGERQ